MKKLLILILTLAMVFCLAACKDKCKNGHLDDDSNGICDRCEATLELDPKPEPEHSVHSDDNTDGRCDGCDSIMIDYGKPTIVGTVLKNNLEKQFNAAKSFKLEFEFERGIVNDKWENGENETENGYIHTEIRDISRNSVELWASKNGDSFDLKIITKDYAFYTESDSDGYFYDYEDDFESVVYVIDGYVYTEMTDDIFKKSEMVTDSLDGMLAKLSSIKLLSQEQKDELLSALGAEVATVLNIKDNKGSMSIDLKDGADELISYITALDLETYTVGEVLNDALALAFDNLTAEDIINELERLSGLTVNEALAELDAWLTENHGTTVQGIHDSIAGNTELLKALEEILLTVNHADPSDTELQETIAGMIEEFKNFNLADFIAENELGELTVYELVASMAGDMPEKDELFEGINAIINMTLAEFDENVADGAISRVQMVITTIRVDALNLMVDVKFENVLELSELSGSLNIDLSRVAPSDCGDKNNIFSEYVSCSFKISQISNAPIEIALADNAQFLDEDFIDGMFESDGGYYIEFDSYTDDDDVYIDVYGEYFDEKIGEVVTLAAWSVPLHVILDDVIILEDANYRLDGVKIEIDGSGLFKFTVDPENHTFTVIETPDLATSSKAYSAFLKLAGNSGEPIDGYSAVEGIIISGYGPTDICIDFVDYQLKFVYFSIAEGDDDYTLVCTLTGFGNSDQYRIIHPTRGTVGYGGYYDTDPEAFGLFFGGDLTFEIVLDPETGVFSLVEYPMIEDQYKSGW